MDFLPLFHNLKGRQVFVVGGGEVAVRKVRLVQEASALVTVVAKEFCPDLVEMAREDQKSGHKAIKLITAPYDHSHMLDLAAIVLVIAATNDRGLNHLVSKHAQAGNILANVVDDPAFSTVIFPSIVDRSPIQIAISSGGDAPVLVRLLRTQLEGLIPAGTSHLASLAGRFREDVKTKFASSLDRKAFWEGVFSGPIAEQAYANNIAEAERLLSEALDNHSRIEMGEVYLVGAGPGDPDLLTFKALRLMQQADIVFYDPDVSAEVLNLVRRDASRVYVGRAASKHPVTQENISQKIIESATQGNRVVRLVGGDPLTLGKSGQEIEALIEHKTPFQVVPGITAATVSPGHTEAQTTYKRNDSDITI
jgi:uroporphyrin-III C-methyltransferase/precorrin-2 dehydrogenase/sirohydrochlorin ferrochelatase